MTRHPVTLFQTPIGANHVPNHQTVVKNSVDPRVDLVMAALPTGAPFFEPKHIAPLLGLQPQSFRYYCRASSKLQNWSGSYRFMTDDPQHLEILRSVINTILWAGRKLPDDLREVTTPERATMLVPRPAVPVVTSVPSRAGTKAGMNKTH